MRGGVLLMTTCLVAGCVTTLKSGAAQVRVVTDREKETACTFIGIVSGAHSIGWTNNQDVESTMNQLRNKAVKMGGNAIKLIHSMTTGGWFSGTASTASAEVLKCDFAKLDEMRK